MPGAVDLPFLRGLIQENFGIPRFFANTRGIRNI
jgi:hypothetical protein